MLDLRRRLKAVADVLDAMIRDAITLARSLELTIQWDGIIRIGPVHPLAVQDFDLARRGGLGEWRQVVEELHLGFSDFIHRVVVHRREEAIRGWRHWLSEDLFVHPYLLLFCTVTLLPLLVGLGFWLIRPGLMRFWAKGDQP